MRTLTEVDVLAQTLPTVVSMLALALSLVNLYLQRRDRRPRLRIRVRYEYRVGDPSPDTNQEGTPPRIHYDSQEGLYLRLGDFLREYALEYPQGTPLIRFSLSNQGERAIYLSGIRLILHAGQRPFRERLVLDPAEERVIPPDLAAGTSNLIHPENEAGRTVELVPGDGAGYKFELVRLANTLKREGHTGNVRLMLEATDRIGNAYRRHFEVNTDLWAYPRE